jgi:hypothetical protein
MEKRFNHGVNQKLRETPFPPWLKFFKSAKNKKQRAEFSNRTPPPALLLPFTFQKRGA